MAAWIPAAIGAGAGLASSLFGGGNRKQEAEVPWHVRQFQQYNLDPMYYQGPYAIHTNVYDLPPEGFGYGPTRVHQGPTPAVQQAYGSLLDRVAGAPYEAAAGDYATRAIQGANLYSNPAMGPLGAYSMGFGTPNYMGGPGRRMMMGTAAGSGYQNPYLDAMVNQAQRRTGANVASMFGRGGMGGSSMETQLAAREMGDIANRMYGGAYEAERGRQTAMQQALGGLETGRLGLGLQGRGQNIGAATTLGQLYGQERGLQQEAAYNVPTLTSSDLSRLQAGVGAATALEGYGTRQRQEELDAWRMNQMAPWQRLQAITGLISGVPNTLTTTTERASANPFSLALGGGLAGYGLWREYQRDQSNPYQTGAPGATAPGPSYNPWGVVGGYTPGVPR